MSNDTKLTIPLQNGQLVATISQDPCYPGIDIEYIDKNEDNTKMSRPRVLIEQPIEDNPKKEIRCLIWNNENQEDYTEEITLFEKKKNK